MTASLIRARHPRFSWSTPAVTTWVPNNTDATHTLNAMHVLFPEAERAFCRVLSSALTHIDDEQLRREVKGFIAQEGSHAHAHATVMDLLVETSPQLQRVQDSAARAFRRLLGSRRTTNRWVLTWRLASVAATEHLTTAVGEWTMTDERLAEHGCDAEMVALVKWHGAEEIEHRSVAFDAHAAVQRRFTHATRVAAMVFWLPTTVVLWARSAQVLRWHDRRGWRVLSPRALRRGITAGLIPDVPAIARGAVAFCSPSYHPSSHVDPDVVARAEEWLHSSALLERTPASA